MPLLLITFQILKNFKTLYQYKTYIHLHGFELAYFKAVFWFSYINNLFIYRN